MLNEAIAELDFFQFAFGTEIVRLDRETIIIDK